MSEDLLNTIEEYEKEIERLNKCIKDDKETVTPAADGTASDGACPKRQEP